MGLFILFVFVAVVSALFTAWAVGDGYAALA